VITSLAPSTWLRVLLTAAILAYLAAQFDMRDALRAVARTDLSHLLVVLALVACDRILMIWRWVLLLRSTGSPITPRAAARIFLVSSFVGSFLPAGVGGDAARAYALMRHTARGGEAVASVAMDRYLGVVALAVLGALGAASSAAVVSPRLRMWLVTAALLFGIASAGMFWLDRVVEAVIPAQWRESTIGHRLRATALAVSDYRRRPGTLVGVLGLSFCVQGLRIVQAYILGRGLGIAVPLRYYVAFMPVGLLLLLLPVSISGFGLPQGVIVWLLRPLGVPDTQSFALSTLIVLSGLAGNLPGAWLYLRGNRASLSSPLPPSSSSS
jgi:uncharacterized protein (TIRG00374 family)